MTTITCAMGTTFEVISQKEHVVDLVSRMAKRTRYFCKRPNGNRRYLVIGFENGTFSTATTLPF